ncbi:MAG: Phosphotransferase enzyme family protein [Chloroflexi bacterium OLB15]|nr:MAG: Phosphotransferase enzyme family protein [Chloroflexi bacterium OLB15]
MSSVLERVQKLQFEDKAAAETLLLTFLRETLNLEATNVELRPLAVSLNSFNGFLTLSDGKRLFFKTHTEPGGIITEYYNAGQLAQAGYPVLQPVYSSTESGKQLLIYEVVDLPSAFDTARQIENGEDAELAAITRAQNRADDALFEIYTRTLEQQTPEDAAKAPVHQLFYHRLTGGRLQQFYGETGEEVSLQLPDGDTVTMADVRKAQWEVNGQQYQLSLDELISSAISHLDPQQAGISIIGHGDAHNGNLFFDAASEKLTYFDPAFAGRHHPLIDLAKPLFHNVFAMWMYFPQETNDELFLDVYRHVDEWQIEYEFPLTPVREMFFESKIERVLSPLIIELSRQNALPSDWRQYLKLALMCCPLLTMNLADQQRFPPSISFLGLAMAVEMGGESYRQRSLIDRALDEVERRLG